MKPPKMEGSLNNFLPSPKRKNKIFSPAFKQKNIPLFFFPSKKFEKNQLCIKFFFIGGCLSIKCILGFFLKNKGEKYYLSNLMLSKEENGVKK